ncbi:hypothetical protein [Streptomyces sp. NPDC058755]|uniref:hypothetical protein n=1 Tax=Streptomyces sp. NPDC058755 TaxID=3346624 RepID=UPI0036C18E27
MKNVTCPHCGQDWIYKYYRKDTGEFFYMCPECESLWLDGQDIEEETDLYLSEYMSRYDPVSVWNVIEKA